MKEIPNGRTQQTEHRVISLTAAADLARAVRGYLRNAERYKTTGDRDSGRACADYRRRMDRLSKAIIDLYNETPPLPGMEGTR